MSKSMQSLLTGQKQIMETFIFLSFRPIINALFLYDISKQCKIKE
jgi:hypothetical protein